MDHPDAIAISNKAVLADSEGHTYGPPVPVAPEIVESEPAQEQQVIVEEEPAQEQQVIVESEPAQEQQVIVEVEQETTQETQPVAPEIVEPELIPETQSVANEIVESEPTQEQQVIEETIPTNEPVFYEIVEPEKPEMVESEPAQEQQGFMEETLAQTTNEPVAPEIVEQETLATKESTPIATNQPVGIMEEPATQDKKTTPKLVFIVPYRDREQHLHFFSKQMADVLSVYPRDDVRVLYVHQCDLRSFNRGAMKNIGFLTVKQEYPETYRDITLVFNDVDTMPFSPGFLNYETTHGRVKHFYGYTFALGGIVSVTAGDFEKLGGFPNLWSWGYEDNLLNYRVLIHKEIKVDRSQFYTILDKNIMHLGDGLEKTVNRKEFDVYLKETPEGFHTITGINILLEPRPNETGLCETFVQVLDFNTGRSEDESASKVHDITTGSRPFGNIQKNPQVLHRRGSARMGLVLR